MGEKGNGRRLPAVSFFVFIFVSALCFVCGYNVQ